MLASTRRSLVVVVVCLVAAVMASGAAPAAEMPGQAEVNEDELIYVYEDTVDASDWKPYALFGSSVAVDADTALVDTFSGNYYTFMNAVYVFTWSGDTWNEQQKLTDCVYPFGSSVALDADTALAVCGACVVIFTRSGDTWNLQQTLCTADDFGIGSSLALSGDTALIGNYIDNVAYVFVRSDGTWSLEQELTAPDGEYGDGFGGAVALYGDTAVVGAAGDDVGATLDQGSAYAFTRSGTTWTFQQMLTGDWQVSDFFGSSVALDGDTALVGALGHDGLQGAAYVFTRSGSIWSGQQKLTASDGEMGDEFGTDVAVAGDTALVGAPRSGAAYIFRRHLGSWSQMQKLTNSESVPYGFGASVALDGERALVGDPWVDGGAGAAYFYRAQVAELVYLPVVVGGGS